MDETFDCVISSQVIEHIAREPVLFDEMWRVLRPGGRLIIGTPDYATWQWRTIEPLYGMLLPWAYRDEHITHYTREDLAVTLERMGFVHEETAYIAGAELIMRYHKPQPGASRSRRPRSRWQPGRRDPAYQPGVEGRLVLDTNAESDGRPELRPRQGRNANADAGYGYSYQPRMMILGGAAASRNRRACV